MPVAMPKLNAVLETALYVDDLPRAKAFYESDLGLPLLFGNQRMCAFDVGGKSVLLLFLRGGSNEPMPTPGGTIPRVVRSASQSASSSADTAKPICSGPCPSWGGIVPPGVGIGSFEPPRRKRSSTLFPPTSKAHMRWLPNRSGRPRSLS